MSASLFRFSLLPHRSFPLFRVLNPLLSTSNPFISSSTSSSLFSYRLLTSSSSSSSSSLSLSLSSSSSSSSSSSMNDPPPLVSSKNKPNYTPLFLHVTPSGDHFTGPPIFAAKHMNPTDVLSIRVNDDFDLETLGEMTIQEAHDVYDTGRIVERWRKYTIDTQ